MNTFLKGLSLVSVLMGVLMFIGGVKTVMDGVVGMYLVVYPLLVFAQLKECEE